MLLLIRARVIPDRGRVGGREKKKNRSVRVGIGERLEQEVEKKGEKRGEKERDEREKERKKDGQSDRGKRRKCERMAPFARLRNRRRNTLRAPRVAQDHWPTLPSHGRTNHRLFGHEYLEESRAKERTKRSPELGYPIRTSPVPGPSFRPRLSGPRLELLTIGGKSSPSGSETPAMPAPPLSLPSFTC